MICSNIYIKICISRKITLNFDRIPLGGNIIFLSFFFSEIYTSTALVRENHYYLFSFLELTDRTGTVRRRITPRRRGEHIDVFVETDFHDLRKNRLHYKTLELRRVHVAVVQTLSETGVQRFDAPYRHVLFGVVLGSRGIPDDPIG